MTINLADPFWGALIGGLLLFIISTGIIGIIKFTIITHQKKLIEDSFFRLRADLELIQKKYQNEITKNNKKLTEIKNRDKEIKAILTEAKKHIDVALNHNPPPNYLDTSQYNKK